MAKRTRSASEWSQLVGEWKRSGQSAGDFARRRGLSPKTLSWWAWRLGRSSKAAVAGGKPSKARVRKRPVGLVSVELEPDRGESRIGGLDEAVVWEVVSPSGYALRVYDREATQALAEALRMVAGASAES